MKILSKKVEGACAIVWYDTLELKLHFIRNTERPLHFGVCKNDDVILFASEAEALYFVAKRNNVELSKIFSLNVGTLLTFDIKDNIETNKLYDGQALRTYYNRGYVHKYSNYWDDDYGSCASYSRPAYIPSVARVGDLFPEDKDNNPFKEVGMYKYDEVEFTVNSFEPYKNKSHGCLRGTKINYPQYKIKVHNYPTTAIPDDMAIVCAARLKAVSVDKKESRHIDKYTLVLDENNVIEVIEDAASSLNYYDEYEDIEWDTKGQKYLVNGQYVDYEVFKKATEDGCEVCSCPINCIDDYSTAWTDTNRPICQDCAKTGDYDSHITVTGV